MYKLDPSNFRYTIDIQQNTPTRGTDGKEIENWGTYLETRANIITFKGKEAGDKEKINTQVDIKFVIRYRSGYTITPNMRVVYDNRNFEIQYIFNENYDNWYIFIVAREVK